MRAGEGAPVGLAHRSTLLKNLLSLAGAELACKLVVFAAFAYLARVAGPAGFGQLELAAAVLFCAALLVEQGFGPYGAREIAREPQRTPELVSEIVCARVALAVVVYAGVVALAFVIDRTPVTRLLVIYGASLLAMPLLLSWVFQGHDQMRVVAATQIIRQTIFAAVVFAGVRTASQLWVAAVAEVAGVCGAAVFGVWMYRRRFGTDTLPRPAISLRLWREGVPIGLSQMLWVTRIFGATLILATIAPARDVGYFAGALRILVAAHTFVWLYFFNLLPSFARAWQRDRAELSTIVARSLHGVAWLAAAGALLWVVAAPAMMTSVYGAAFAPAGRTLQWLAPVCAVAALSGHYRFGLIAAGRQNAEMWTSALGATVAAVSIPVGYFEFGVHGAAIGLLAAEVVVWLAAWWCGRRILALRHHAGLLLRPTVALVLTAALVWSLPMPSLPARAGTVVVSMVALALALDRRVRSGVRWSAALLLSRSWRRGRRDLLHVPR